ncbi:MAG: MerR family transcriptional regulator [Treponema sp.]|nr:MerR family transcriptional regulator [Candidatus Treponema caballi]
MADFSIGEVEALTGIKAHVLRYWEEIVPSLSPKMDIGGRRAYSTRDVQVIFRLKYLIQEKKFTIEGARNHLILEADTTPHAADMLQQINEIRGDILSIYKILHNSDAKK